MLISDKPYELTFALASSAVLIPYVFTAFYQVKYSLASKESDKYKNLIIGFIASLYGIWLVYAADLKYLMLTTLLYAPGILIFIKVQKENNKKVFTSNEKIVAILLALSALITFVTLVI